MFYHNENHFQLPFAYLIWEQTSGHPLVSFFPSQASRSRIVSPLSPMWTKIRFPRQIQLVVCGHMAQQLPICHVVQLESWHSCEWLPPALKWHLGNRTEEFKGLRWGEGAPWKPDPRRKWAATLKGAELSSWRNAPPHSNIPSLRVTQSISTNAYQLLWATESFLATF